MASTPRTPTRMLGAPALGPERLTFHVGGLTCASDAVRLEREVRGGMGVLDVMVNPITEIVYVTVDPARTTPEAVRRHIDATSYGPATR